MSTSRQIIDLKDDLVLKLQHVLDALSVKLEQQEKLYREDHEKLQDTVKCLKERCEYLEESTRKIESEKGASLATIKRAYEAQLVYLRAENEELLTCHVKELKVATDKTARAEELTAEANLELERLQTVRAVDKRDLEKELRRTKDKLSLTLEKQIWTEEELAKERGRRAIAELAIQKVLSDIVNASA